jgi:hypothetical protein
LGISETGDLRDQGADVDGEQPAGQQAEMDGLDVNRRDG